MRLILLGAPGTGKGTQAGRLSEKFNVPHVSTGDMFRAAITAGTPVGTQAKSYIDAGQLVPDDVTIGIVRERLEEPDTRKGWIFDGFPRTVAQARGLDNILEARDRNLDAVLLMSVSEDRIIMRISGRRICKESGRIYNLELAPQEWEASEDKAKGHTLLQRSDDRPELVKERLHQYHEQTEPLVEYYRKRGQLLEIDGVGTVDAVFERIVEAL